MAETSRPIPAFAQLNLLVHDMDATLAFYRQLGLEISEGPGDWPPGSGGRHASTTAPNGTRIEFDNAAMAKIWHGGFSEREARAGTIVVGFDLPTRDAVDALYAELLTAGVRGRQEPYDGFWGARYAIVEDPDGNDVGLMSPIDPDRRYTPSL